MSTARTPGREFPPSKGKVMLRVIRSIGNTGLQALSRVFRLLGALGRAMSRPTETTSPGGAVVQKAKDRPDVRVRKRTGGRRRLPSRSITVGAVLLTVLGSTMHPKVLKSLKSLISANKLVLKRSASAIDDYAVSSARSGRRTAQNTELPTRFIEHVGNIGAHRNQVLRGNEVFEQISARWRVLEESIPGQSSFEEASRVGLRSSGFSLEDSTGRRINSRLIEVAPDPGKNITLEIERIIREVVESTPPHVLKSPDQLRAAALKVLGAPQRSNLLVSLDLGGELILKTTVKGVPVTIKANVFTAIRNAAILASGYYILRSEDPASLLRTLKGIIELIDSSDDFALEYYEFRTMLEEVRQDIQFSLSPVVTHEPVNSVPEGALNSQEESG